MSVLPRYAFVDAVSNERDIFMRLRKLYVLSALVGGLSSAGVTLAADVSVNGQIQPNGVCSMTLGSGGVIDLGTLSRKDHFPHPSYGTSRSIKLTLNCQQPTKVGVNVIDNRKGTASEDDPWYFGLGNPAIGHYTIATYDAQIDGREGIEIWRRNGSTTWYGKEIHYLWASNGKTLSWDVIGPQIEPVAFKTLTTTVEIVFRPKYDSVFLDEHKLDGSATLELVYL
ncbi:DUF1120 domain-containing protein [Burkholderia contaminans]|uniref:DUF1120 domain-containing protein n=1 Tax=Burkholderia contaminans TaxID=488447 RepID=UPI002415EA96|nr:DUF1120 domain-containing protein [Burkholderia contaminans]WFN14782.1 DUF1120 domain-containing protein [Burkholderia contaminans]